MQNIEILISNEQEQVVLPDKTTEIIEKCVKSVLFEENFVESVEISVLFVDNAEIKALNHEYRSIDSVTDVLSFPMDETNPDTGYQMLGDIVISAERAAEQAAEYGHTLEREVAFLTIHSMLHLLGYDHVDDEAGETVMREKQTRLLDALGFGV